MQSLLSKRIQSIQPSATMSISSKAKALKAAGKDIISLSLGESDFNTPENVQKSAIKAIETGNNKYTAPEGSLELREAIVHKFQRDNDLNYNIGQVMASTGGKQAIFNLFSAILDQGDEVIIPAPYWASYPDMVIVNEGSPVIITCSVDQDYKMTAEQLEQAITPKTKLLILNSPSNPTGMVYSDDEMAKIGQVLIKNPHVYILSDDIYEHILWTEQGFQNIVNICPELKDRAIIVNGLSKAYAMTGWRLGFAAGPEEIIQAMKKMQSQSTSCPCSITQMAAIEALNGDQSELEVLKDTFKERHDFVYQRLSQLKGFKVSPAQGAFYMFPHVEHAYQALSLKDDIAFAEYLIDKAGVALVPGTAFGSPGAIRMSYAMDISTLGKAINRIEESLA